MTKEEYIEQVNLKVATKEALLALEQKEDDRKQGALEVLQKIDYHKDWIDRNCKTILEKEEYAYKYLQELQKEYEKGVSK